MRSNPSIERTSSSKLRLLPAAAHVKRWAFMFSLFHRKYKDGVLVVSESEFWDRLKSECTDREFFDAQRDKHSAISAWGPISTLIHHFTRPGRKAAQAGEFKL